VFTSTFSRTFRASGRSSVWACCFRCKRALWLSPFDPMIADQEMTVGFRCQRCSTITKASYEDPRNYKDGVEWEVEDRWTRYQFKDRSREAKARRALR
jgi:hypothetical protein